MTLKKFFAFFSPFNAAVAKVAPEVEAKIEKILSDARFKADTLRAMHDSSAIDAQYKADLAAARAVYDRQVELLKADNARRNAEIKLVLPSVADQFGYTGSTGMLGPSGLYISP